MEYRLAMAFEREAYRWEWWYRAFHRRWAWQPYLADIHDSKDDCTVLERIDLPRANLVGAYLNMRAESILLCGEG